MLTACYNPTGAKSYRWVRVDGVRVTAHRAAWQAVNGPIPDGMVIMHLCDNRPCSRIDHLKLGTQSENIQDAWDKGLVRVRTPPPESTHCRQGHLYDGKRDNRGAQLCNECERPRKRDWMRAKRAEARA